MLLAIADSCINRRFILSLHLMFILRHILLVCLMLLLPLFAEAQQVSALLFESTTLDFGTIEEAAGEQTRRFEARNTGSESVVVREVISTCDCTVVEYSSEAVAPGQSFGFDVVYDPWGRPGRFERTIFVVVSDSEEPLELKVKGRVTPRERSVEEVYPYDMGGGLRLESTFASFSYVEHGKQYQQQIAYVNTSDRAITLRLRPQLSSSALDVYYPKVIEPGAMGDIILCYSLPCRSRCYGTLDDRFFVEVNGESSRFMLTSYAVAVDNFDDVDDILSPRAVFSKKNIKFGDVNPVSGGFDAYFELSNEGEAQLLVRKVECDSRALRCNLRRGSKLSPGQSRAVRIRFKPRKVKIEGESFTERLNIVTNDPVTPLQVIKVTATIHQCKDNELDK